MRGRLPVQMHAPEQPTPLIGRQAELAAASAEVVRGGTRLLTLAGPGGSGKTRFALALADSLRLSFPDGAYFVDLSAVRDPARVAPAVMRELGIADAARPPFDALAAHLRDLELLLVLDNFEQVIGASSMVSDLLAACPRLRVLVTSREALHLRWEHEWPVPPLATPALGTRTDLAALAANPSVILFTERARAADPSFALSAANARDVAEVCVRLDGLPLAIELAAAHARALSPAALLALLRAAVALPGAGPRDAPDRQRTLEATMDWSYALLDDRERGALARLSVFAGSWTAAAADEILELPALPVLSSLVEKNLVRREPATDGDRFAMLATIREYARERLRERGEAEVVLGRHARHYFALADRTNSGVLGRDQDGLMRLVERAHDDLRAALRHTIDAGRPGEAGRAAVALSHFWYRRGHAREARAWFAELLDRLPPGRTPVRADVLSHLADHARAAGDLPLAESHAYEALAIHRERGDLAGTEKALRALGLIALDQGEPTAARVHFLEALSLAERIGNARATWASVVGLAEAALRLGDRDEADRLCGRAEELVRATGHSRGLALVRHTMALIARDRGDRARAEALAAEAVTILHGSGEESHMAASLDLLAGLASDDRRATRAARLSAAADVLRAAAGTTVPRAEAADRERALRAARAALGPGGFADAVAGGAALTPAEVVAYAATSDGSEPALGSGLTARESEVAHLVAQGLSDRRIAELLVIGERTVESHVARILRKLDVPSRARIAARLDIRTKDP